MHSPSALSTRNADKAVETGKFGLLKILHPNSLRYTETGPNDGTVRVRMEAADLVQVDVKNGEFIVASFSNGDSVKIATSKFKALALRESAETVGPEYV